jgi:hypothetical protein
MSRALALILFLFLVLTLTLILSQALPLPLRLSSLHDRLLAGIGHCILVLRQTTENSTAAGLHPGTQVLCVGLARGAHLV